MSNHPWVCFPCRHVVRRDGLTTTPVVCAFCGEACTHLSPTVKFPPKSKPKGWEKLKERVHRNLVVGEERYRKEIAERKRWLKKRIKELEGAKPSANRDYLLQQHYRELSEFPVPK